jgi:hypothetical protein
MRARRHALVQRTRAISRPHLQFQRNAFGDEGRRVEVALSLVIDLNVEIGSVALDAVHHDPRGPGGHKTTIERPGLVSVPARLGPLDKLCFDWP